LSNLFIEEAGSPRRHRHGQLKKENEELKQQVTEPMTNIFASSQTSIISGSESRKNESSLSKQQVLK
jgi:hypothetical protein